MIRVAELWRVLVPVLWAVWIALWLAAAFNVKRPRWRENLGAAMWNRVPVLLGMFLMMTPRGPWGPLAWPLVPPGPAASLTGVALTAAGLVFTGWARWHLGGNWSGTVTVKEGHTLTVSGPYRWVRHPIYSGLTLALLGTALAVGTAGAFAGAALILLGFILKLRVEEARMRDTFPAEYDAYCRRTARLIPGVF